MKKQILYTSDEAAKLTVGIKGWVDRKRYFHGMNEHAARLSGCTHIICPGCGALVKKTRTKCKSCREKYAIERYEAREFLPWDGETPLYSWSADEYFFDHDSLLDYMDDNGCTQRSLRLGICKPLYLREIAEDYFEDELPSDGGGLPDEIWGLLDELNEVIRSLGPVSWEPGKYAAFIPRYVANSIKGLRD